MRSSSSLRWLGLAAMAGGLLWTVGFLVHSAQPRGCIAEECSTRPMRDAPGYVNVLWVLALILLGVGGLALILLLRKAGRSWRLGKAGLIVAGAGMVILLLGPLPLSASQREAWMPIFVIPGLVLIVIGFVLLGVAVLRAHVLPTWAALALLGGALLMLLGNEQTARALLFVPFGLAWVAVGFTLWFRLGNRGREAIPTL